MKSIRSILAGITGLFAMLFLTSCSSAGESAPEPVTESFTVLLVVDEEPPHRRKSRWLRGSGHRLCPEPGHYRP